MSEKKRTCPVCNGTRFIDGFQKYGLSMLCPICGGDGCVLALGDRGAIIFGEEFESLKREDSP